MKEIFWLTDINMEIVLVMFFLSFNNSNEEFDVKKPTWRSYTTAKALITVKRVKLINKHEFILTQFSWTLMLAFWQQENWYSIFICQQSQLDRYWVIRASIERLRLGPYSDRKEYVFHSYLNILDLHQGLRSKTCQRLGMAWA